MNVYRVMALGVMRAALTFALALTLASHLPPVAPLGQFLLGAVTLLGLFGVGGWVWRATADAEVSGRVPWLLREITGTLLPWALRCLVVLTALEVGMAVARETVRVLGLLPGAPSDQAVQSGAHLLLALLLCGLLERGPDRAS